MSFELQLDGAFFAPLEFHDASVLGLAARTDVAGAVAGSDRLTVNALAGDDVVDASALAASALLLSVNGGTGDDVIIGGAGDDTLNGNEGDDVVLGGPGQDVIDGGLGDNVVIQLVQSARTVKGKTVLKVDGESVKLPRAKVAQLVK